MPHTTHRLPLLTVLLAGLATGGCAVAEGLGAVEVAAVPVIHRTLTDAIYSTITGKDCSVVRLDEFKTYCRPTEPRPPLPPYCTKSLARADCWVDPQHLYPMPPQVADGPMTLTPEQDADRTRRWPPL